jgi:hypothetical protein
MLSLQKVIFDPCIIRTTINCMRLTYLCIYRMHTNANHLVFEEPVKVQGRKLP